MRLTPVERGFLPIPHHIAIFASPHSAVTLYYRGLCLGLLAALVTFGNSLYN